MELPNSIKVNYLKSPSYRTVHVDGAVGGATPSLNMYIALWSQRGSLPDVSVHAVTPEGNFEAVPQSVHAKSDGLVREVECGLMMSLEAAKNLHLWLGEKIAELEKITAAASKGVVQ